PRGPPHKPPAGILHAPRVPTGHATTSLELAVELDRVLLFPLARVGAQGDVAAVPGHLEPAELDLLVLVGAARHGSDLDEVAAEGDAVKDPLVVALDPQVELHPLGVVEALELHAVGHGAAHGLAEAAGAEADLVGVDLAALEVVVPGLVEDRAVDPGLEL